YTRNELTEILQVSLTTVGTLINQGDIFSIKVGKSIRVPEWRCVITSWASQHISQGTLLVSLTTMSSLQIVYSKTAVMTHETAAKETIHRTHCHITSTMRYLLSQN